MHFVHQEGQAVFKYASRKMYEVCRDLLARNSVSVGDISVMVPHQANLRIIKAAAERLGIPLEKVVIKHRELRQHHRCHDSAGPRATPLPAAV